MDNGSLIAGFLAEAARGSSSLEITLYVPRGPALITKYSIVRHGVLLMIERHLEMLKRSRQERKKKKKEENERDELQNELPSNDGNRGGGCISRGLPRRP